MNWIHPLGILIIAILVELFHLACISLHYTVYAYDGRGVFGFYVFACISKIIASVLVIWTLLMIGFGWTISYEDLEDKDIYVIIGCFTLMIHMMIAGLTFIDYFEADKYHDFGGPQGAILIGLRIALFIGFMVGISMT